MPEVFCNTSPLQYLYQLGLLTLQPIVAELERLGFHLDPTTRQAVLKLAGENP